MKRKKIYFGIGLLILVIILFIGISWILGKKELKQKERPEEKVPQTKRESMSGQLEKEIEKQEEVK